MKKYILTLLAVLVVTNFAHSANKVVVIPLNSGGSESDATPASSSISISPEKLALLQWFPSLTHTQGDFSTGSGAGAVAFDGTNIWVGNRDPGGAASSLDILDLNGSAAH